LLHQQGALARARTFAGHGDPVDPPADYDHVEVLVL
jgi:hypothetical protein